MDGCLSRCDAACGRAGRWLDALSLPAFIVVAVAATLCLDGFFYSSRWIFVPNSPDWVRALEFLRQCANPAALDVEPSLRWRLLPAWTAHFLGLRGFAPLMLPGLGFLALLVALARVFARSMSDRFTALCSLALCGTTSAGLVQLTLFGMNDAWAWLGLVAAAFSPRLWPLAAACLLCPWVDERFLIGLPAALLIRSHIAGLGARDRIKTFLLAGLLLLPYVLPRAAHLLHPAGRDASFIHSSLIQVSRWITYVPIGWWMAYRLMWGAVILALVRARDGWLFLCSVGALFVLPFFAWDLSRSPADLLPLAVWGLILIPESWPSFSRRIVAALLAAQLAIPAGHVIADWFYPIFPLPVVLLRFLPH